MDDIELMSVHLISLTFEFANATIRGSKLSAS